MWGVKLPVAAHSTLTAHPPDNMHYEIKALCYINMEHITSKQHIQQGMLTLHVQCSYLLQHTNLISAFVKAHAPFELYRELWDCAAVLEVLTFSL